jgi:transcriptional regulator with XRE-family HTH domain
MGHDDHMARDWKRLAEAVRHERTRRNLTQLQLADAAGIVEASLQKLERGDGYTRMPSTPYRVAEHFGWTLGSIEDILGGGSPTLSAAVVPAETEGAEPGFLRGMPLRVAEVLQRGEVVDTEVLEFGPDGARMEMIVVLRRREGGAAVDPEQMRLGLERWTRAQQEIRKIASEEG